MNILKIFDFFKPKLISQTSGSLGIDLSTLEPELRAALEQLRGKSPAPSAADVQALIDRYRR